MIRLTIIGILILTSISASSQNISDRQKNKAGELYNQAMIEARDGDIPAGIKSLKSAIKIWPSFFDAHLSIAGMFGELKQYDSAITYYQKARLIDSSSFKDYALSYSINLAGKGLFEEALVALKEFQSLTGLREASVKAAAYREQCYRFAIDYEKKLQLSKTAFEPKNMGDSINSIFSEYYPTLTIDGQQLIFTRKVKNFNEDFFGSTRTGTGISYSIARGLEGNINTNRNEGAQNISQDGEWLIFTGCNFPDSYGSCDLYISYLTPDGWSEPENLGEGINTESWESAPSLSPDKRDLYFTSSRPGGYGNSDLYVTHRLPNGRWTEPENLGPNVNTIGEEGAPFIHADNHTLYFTSNGHPGYGNQDLFLVKKEGPNTWSKAENLGFPINTIENEGSIFIAADGKTAYYASDRSDSKGGLDLYSFELREGIRPSRTVWVKGKVYDEETQKGLPSAVDLTDLETRELVSKVQTDETGNYLITLPVGKDYAFNVNRRGYLFYSDNFPLSEKEPDSVYSMNIPLKPIRANASIVLKNVFFDTKSSELKNTSMVELDQLVLLLKENPSLKIRIEGHTDNVGKPEDNLVLSRKRAASVVQYLQKKGIDISRLTSSGFGETQPVAENNTEEGRAKNRRTEMKVLSLK